MGEAPRRSFLVAQLGARAHYAVPRILAGAGWLERLYTDVWADGRLAARAQAWLPQCAQVALLRRFLARRAEDVPECKVTSFPSLGFAYGLVLAAARSEAARTAAHLGVGVSFCRRILGHGFGAATAVYTFSSAGLELLRHARACGLFTVVEQIGAPRYIEDQILGEECERWLGWEKHGDNPLAKVLAEREMAEWHEADVILCASEFVREGIRNQHGPAERCRLVPLGVTLKSVVQQARSTGPCLRVLFIGGVRVGKGVQYLGKAAEKLGNEHFEFRLVGPVRLSRHGVKSLRQWVDVVGPVPRSQVAEELARADVFVFPSLCEGFGLSVVEAMAAGLPVITTTNARSVVRDGVDGFIVPIRDVDALVSRLDLLAALPELRRWMSEQARQRAQEFTVERYGERLLAALG